jgi:PIN domain nuclease of toxin-antitoxin system
MQPILLDTCAVIWIAEGEAIARNAMALLNEANAEQAGTYVSPITAWEVGMLASRERLRLLITPQRWFARILEAPNVRLAEMPADLLIASSFLPGKPPRDPVDRIIAATARELGATLVTRDRMLLDYGEQGHVKIIAC